MTRKLKAEGIRENRNVWTPKYWTQINIKRLNISKSA